MFKILVVEDDPNYRQYLGTVLKQANYDVTLAENGLVALDEVDKQSFSLIILDIMMPKLNGFDFLRTIRSSLSIPVLIISAKNLPEDKRTAFLIGTDDYLVKPIDEEEMLLRIKALLRRANIESEKKIIVNSVCVDYNAMTVSTEQQTITLPKKEFLLLYKLLYNLNKAYTRFQLLEEIWGYDNESDESTVSVHINRLRNRLKDITDFEIQTVWGIGYKAVKNEK